MDTTSLIFSNVPSWSLELHFYHRKPMHEFCEFFRALSTTVEKGDESLKWSYVFGQTDVPLQGITIGRCLGERTELTPDKEAAVFVEQGIRQTFSQLLEDVGFTDVTSR